MFTIGPVHSGIPLLGPSWAVLPATSTAIALLLAEGIARRGTKCAQSCAVTRGT